MAACLSRREHMMINLQNKISFIIVNVWTGDIVESEGSDTIGLLEWRLFII